MLYESPFRGVVFCNREVATCISVMKNSFSAGAHGVRADYNSGFFMNCEVTDSNNNLLIQ